MEGKINVDTKFTIKDIDVYDRLLNLGGLHAKANKAAKQFENYLDKKEERSAFQGFVNYLGNGKNIYNNKINQPIPFQSLRNINTILCFFFSEHTGYKYEVKDVKTFLKNFEAQEGLKDSNSITSFNSFINLIRPHLSEKFNKYNYTINPKTWEFEVSKIYNNIKTRSKGQSDEQTVDSSSFEKLLNLVKVNLRIVIGVLIFILIGILGLNYFPSKNPVPEKESVEVSLSDVNSQNTSSCYFENDSLNRYKILIVPFEKMGGFNGNTNIGKEIENRLDRLNQGDSLNLQVHYCKDFIYNKKSDDGDETQYYTRVMNEHNANHIIYGAKVEVGDYNNPDLTQLQVNYCVKPNTELSRKIQFQTQSEYSLVTLADLSNGVLLGDIEYVIYLNSAISLYNRGDYLRAINYLDLVNDVGQGRYDYIKLRSKLNAHLGNLETALKYADELFTIKLESNDLSSSYNDRGVIKTFLCDDSALEDFKKAISLNPKSPVAYQNFAKHKWISNNDYKDAKQEFESAINLFNDIDSKAYLYGGKIALGMQAEQYKDALEDIESVLSFEDKQPLIYINKGEALYNLGRNLESIDAFKKSISLDTLNSSEAHLWLVHIYMEIGESNKALNSFDKVLDFYFCDEATFDSVFFYYYNQNQLELAKRLTEHCLIQNPRNYFLLNHRRNIYIDQKQFNKADSVFERMDEISPTVYFQYNEQDELLDFFPFFDSLSRKSRTHYKLIMRGSDTISKLRILYDKYNQL